MNMRELNLPPSYIARERFSREVEARRRRTEPGATGRKVADWCFRQLADRVAEGPVLDLACGNGRHFNDLAKLSVQLIAGDYSLSMLHEAQSRAGGTSLCRFEAERLPFEEASFEAVFSGRFFHHLPTTEVRELILSDMFRVSRRAVAITYKSKFSLEHLLHRLKCLIRHKPQTRFFSPASEFEVIAKKYGWRVSSCFSPGGPLSANRGLLFEPLGEKTA